MMNEQKTADIPPKWERNQYGSCGGRSRSVRKVNLIKNLCERSLPGRSIWAPITVLLDY